MPEENKALVRRWVEGFNEGDLDAVDELVTDSYVRHDPNSPEVHGPEEEKQLIAKYRSAFPDLNFTIEDLIAEGDRVVIRVGITATHKGELLGIPPDREPTNDHGDRDLPPGGEQDRRAMGQLGHPRHDAAARRHPHARTVVGKRSCSCSNRINAAPISQNPYF